MRIAVSIIAGGLTLVIALQSCTAQVGGGVSRNAPLRAAGDAGWLIALLYLLGAGFAYGVPALAAIVFGLTGVISLGIGANTGVGAFGFWGLLALTLATMSLAGWREKRRAFRRPLLRALRIGVDGAARGLTRHADRRVTWRRPGIPSG
jgi:hypothetical protein